MPGSSEGQPLPERQHIDPTIAMHVANPFLIDLEDRFELMLRLHQMAHLLDWTKDRHDKVLSECLQAEADMERGLKSVWN